MSTDSQGHSAPREAWRQLKAAIREPRGVALTIALFAVAAFMEGVAWSGYVQSWALTIFLGVVSGLGTMLALIGLLYGMACVQLHNRYSQHSREENP